MDGQVFCDDLRLTLPHDAWGHVSASVEGCALDAGMSPEFASELKVLWRCDGGVLRSESRGRVRSVVASGQALARFRAMKMLGRYLSSFAGLPHRVTGLHATTDVAQPAAPVIASLLAKAESPDGLRAGRKRIPLGDLQRYLVRLPTGEDTGSIYCGARTNEIRPVVYDKQRERIEKGFPDPGPLTRYELRLRDVGATIGDAYDPTAVFWHYMAPDFLPSPAHLSAAPPWVAGGSGFDLPPAQAFTPARRLLNRLDSSADVADLLRLASSFDGGDEFLLAHLRRRLERLRAAPTVH